MSQAAMFKEPNRALIDGILMTPVQVKLVPSPVRMIVGTLSQTILLQALDPGTLVP